MRRSRTIPLALAAATLAVTPTFGQGSKISDDVVRIGILTDMSGIYSDLSGKGAVEAVRMAVADYGDKVLGKPIEVINADHQNKPDIGSNIARQWFDRLSGRRCVRVAAHWRGAETVSGFLLEDPLDRSITAPIVLETCTKKQEAGTGRSAGRLVWI
jgi:hypothetical protein